MVLIVGTLQKQIRLPPAEVYSKSNLYFKIFEFVASCVAPAFVNENIKEIDFAKDQYFETGTTVRLALGIS